MSYFSTDEDICNMKETVRDIASLMFTEEETDAIMDAIGDDIEVVYDMTKDMDGNETYLLFEGIMMENGI